MYTSIVKNFVKKLIENEFQLSTTFHIETEKEKEVVVLLKGESPILYVASLVNGSKINLQNYEIFMNEYLQYLQKSLKVYYCTNIIALTIVAGEFLEEMEHDKQQTKDFVMKQEFILEEHYSHTWWYLSEARKTIEMNKSQAKDILHIKQIALKSLEEKESCSLEEIVTQAKQKMMIKNDKIVVTWVLLFINCFLFFMMVLCGEKENYILSYGTEYHAIFNLHQYYRIFTYCFIHADIMHLIQNSVYLYFFGMRAELLYGKIQMLLLYFFAATGSSILSAYCNDVLAVGASGAIFGLIGAVFVYSYRNGKRNVGMNYSTLLLLVIVALLAGVLQKNVDYFGHLGGFLAGSLLSFMILQGEKPDRRREK